MRVVASPELAQKRMQGFELSWQQHTIQIQPICTQTRRSTQLQIVFSQVPAVIATKPPFFSVLGVSRSHTSICVLAASSIILSHTFRLSASSL